MGLLNCKIGYSRQANFTRSKFEYLCIQLLISSLLQANSCQIDLKERIKESVIGIQHELKSEWRIQLPLP
jgi:hypothetical protein